MAEDTEEKGVKTKSRKQGYRVLTYVKVFKDL